MRPAGCACLKLPRSSRWSLGAWSHWWGVAWLMYWARILASTSSPVIWRSIRWKGSSRNGDRRWSSWVRRWSTACSRVSNQCSRRPACSFSRGIPRACRGRRYSRTVLRAWLGMSPRSLSWLRCTSRRRENPRSSVPTVLRSHGAVPARACSLRLRSRCSDISGWADPTPILDVPCIWLPKPSESTRSASAASSTSKASEN